MNREEAKRRLECCRDFLANNYSDMGEPNFTAFNMAIEALEQEPCEDCISRAEAIESIKHAQVNFSVKSEIDFTKHKREVQEIADGILNAQIKALGGLPPVQPKADQEPCEDCIRRAYDKGFDDGLEEGLKVGACEDCISRQEAIDNSWELIYPDSTSEMVVSVKDIEQLPSVTPAKKTGHWIYTKMVNTGEIRWSECSECGNGESGCAKRMKYCPNCGIRMREVEE